MKRNKYFVWICLGIFSVAGLTVPVFGHRAFSANENRYLTQLPAFSVSDFLSREWQETLTESFNDQFPVRDFWTKETTAVKKAMGAKDAGGVYIGKNHYYFSKVMQQDISQTNYYQNLRFVQHLADRQKDAHVMAMLVPSPGTILEEYLPSHATLYDADTMYREAEKTWRDITKIDLRSALLQQKQSQQVYFKTDHHWTLQGAYAGYQAYCEAAGLKAAAYDQLNIQAESEDFYGTLYSKALDGDAVPDTLYALKPETEVEVTCDGQKRDGIYDAEKLKEKDQYAYFFGGNYGEVHISSKKNVTNAGKKLFVIKDSFANSMVPFLLGDYEQIKMLDLRYYKGSVASLLDEYAPQDILVLYEMSNFAQDEKLNLLTK